MSAKVRTEVRESWPFARSESFFDGCALKLDPSDGFDSKKAVFEIERSDADVVQPLRLELRFNLDPDHLRSVTGVQEHPVQVRVAVKNDDARRHDVISEWPVEAVPKTHAVTLRGGTYGPGKTEVNLAAVLGRSTAANGKVTAYRRASSLASRAFVLVPPQSARLLPVYNTDFAERGWPGRALYKIEFRSMEEITSRPPDELLEVHLNEGLPVLMALFGKNATRDKNLAPTARLLRPFVVSQVLADVALPVLFHLCEMKDDQADVIDDVEADSLAGALLRTLTRQLDLGTEELLHEAREAPELLRTRIQHLVGVGAAYGMDMLETLRRPS